MKCGRFLEIFEIFLKNKIMSNYSVMSDDEESGVLSDVDMIGTEDRKTVLRPDSQKRRDSKEKKTVVKKLKKIGSYRDQIGKFLKDQKIGVDITNSMSIRQDDGILVMKTPVDEKSTDYWTVSHYKTKNIEFVDSKDRWKHAECTIRVAMTDQIKDQTLISGLDDLIQAFFDRFMKDSKKKITRI